MNTIRHGFLLASMMAALAGCGDDTGGSGGAGGSGGGGDTSSSTTGSGGGSAESYLRFTAKGKNLDLPLLGPPLFGLDTEMGPEPLAYLSIVGMAQIASQGGTISFMVPSSEAFIPADTYECGDGIALSVNVDGHRAGAGQLLAQNFGEGGTCSITLDVDAEPGATVTGTFSGTLVAGDRSNDPAELVVTNGSFKATISGM